MDSDTTSLETTLMKNPDFIYHNKLINANNWTFIGRENYLLSNFLRINKGASKKSSFPNIIITIPAFNEGKVIGNVVKKIKQVMDKTKDYNNYLILVVNDGSIDDTIQSATEAGAIVYSQDTHVGLAETFRTEMELCLKLNADIVVHTDADGQYQAEDIPYLIAEVQKGNDLVLGSRFKGAIESMPLLKRIGNRIFSSIVSTVTKQRITDSQTGFRVFTREITKKIQIESNHTYTQEQIIRAIKSNYKVKELPIFFSKRHNGKSRLIKNPIEYAFKALKTILKTYFDY